MTPDIDPKLERSVRRWKRAALGMAVVTTLTLYLLLPPLIASKAPGEYYPAVLGIVPREYRVPTLPDSDMDGLPNSVEDRSGTDPASTDTDGDGLSDYDEIRKYGTNPLESDSDSDGARDDDWLERREYAYTIRAVVDLRPPFRPEDMNDLYQDARLLDHADGASRFEVILYPEAKEYLNPAPYTPVDGPYTAPTYTKNWDGDMRQDLRRRMGRPATDLQATAEILRRLVFFRFVEIDRDLGYSTDWPLQFDVYRDEGGRVHERYYGIPLGASMEEIEQQVFFATGMYRNRTHGTCSSLATIRGAMLRAVGLEEQTIFSIPLFYSLRSDGTEIAMGREYPRDSVDMDESNREMSDHFYTQVKIGSRWVRVDRGTIDTGLNGPSVKLLLCHDQVDLRFDSWNKTTWFSKRPYVYRSIGDQEPKHRR